MHLQDICFQCTMSVIGVVLACSFGEFLQVSAEKIVDHQLGGNRIGIEEFVWFTAIREGEEGEFRCGGALVGSRYVVTASHCVENHSRISVEVGYWCRRSDNCDRESDIVGVQNLFRHRSEDDELGGDMVLLELSRPVNFEVTPAIPYLGEQVHPKQRPLKKKHKMTMVGGGLEGTRGPISEYVTKLEVQYLKSKICKKRISTPSLVTDTVICSTVLTPDGSPCKGDSGSPLVVAGKGKWKERSFILGVHSKGLENCDAATETQPSLHFRMSEAADLLQSVVCEGHYPEDWCKGRSPSSAQPTKSPTHTPGPTFTSGPNKVARATLLHVLEGHTNWVSSVSFNSNGSRLGTYGNDIRVWNPIEGGDALSIFATDTIGVALRWNPSDSMIASGDVDGSIKLWNVLQQGEPPMELFPSHSRGILALEWHPNGDVLASASSDDTIRIWNVESASSLKGISFPSNFEGLSFRPDGLRLVSSGGNNTFHVWDVQNNYELLRTFTESDVIWSVEYSPNGQYVATASEDGGVRLWDVTSGEVHHELIGHTASVYSVAWSADGKYVVSGSRDASVRVWDVENGGGALLVLWGHTNSVFSVDWSPDGTHIASGASDNSTMIWRIEGL